jgi:hypothetical protein
MLRSSTGKSRNENVWVAVMLMFSRGCGLVGADLVKENVERDEGEVRNKRANMK